MTLQSGDYGVQKIDSIEWYSDDVGTVALVLVMPITTLFIYDLNTPNIHDLWFQYGHLPEVMNDAYLAMIFKNSATSTGTATNTFFGQMTTLWKAN